MVEVGRMSIWTIVVYFVMYIIMHTFFVYAAKKYTADYEKDKKEETKKTATIFNFIAKWFPGMYVVFLLIVFYF